MKKMPEYLILAHPKSASTSLLNSIGEPSGLSYSQQMQIYNDNHGFFLKKILKVLNRKRASGGMKHKYSPFKLTPNFREVFPSVDYPLLSMAHSDIADFGNNDLINEYFKFESSIHKQHFPPTDGNRILFRNVKKVILIRDVDEIIDSYLRVPKETIFKTLLKDDVFMEKVKKELVMWEKGWLEEKENSLVINHKDLVKNQKGTLLLVADYFSLINDSNKDSFSTLSKNRVYRKL